MIYEAAAALFPTFLAGAGISSEAEFLATYMIDGRPCPDLAEFDIDMVMLTQERFLTANQIPHIGLRTLQ